MSDLDVAVSNSVSVAHCIRSYMAGLNLVFTVGA